MRLRIVRKGKFAVVNNGATAEQCGLLGTQIFKYVVVIHGNDQHLNKHGFIIDNLGIDHYFQKKYAVGSKAPFVSCERMAAGAVRDFRKMFELQKGDFQGSKTYRIEVMIAGSEEAEIYAEWESTEVQSEDNPVPALKPVVLPKHLQAKPNKYPAAYWLLGRQSLD